MNDTKQWWQSKIVIAQLVSVLFAILAAAGVLPTGIDQGQVVEAVTGAIAIATLIMRLKSTHAIEKPTLPKSAAPLLAFALAVPCALMTLGSLQACATVPIAQVGSALDRADAAFARLQLGTAAILPLMPADQQVRVRAILATIAQTLSAARTATTIADQAQAIATVNHQVAALAAELGR